MLEEVSLSPEAVLIEDGVEFLLRLRGDFIVQILIAVGDVLPEIDLARVNLSGEHLALIIS